MSFVFYLWAALSLTEILLCGLDKYYAKSGRWRIPEKVLLGAGLLGGSLGLVLGMLLFHHKVSKPAFRFGAPLMVLLHLALLVLAVSKGWLPG